MDENVNTIINVAGDYVQNKTVEHEIGNVEAGGIGIQINHHPHFGSTPNIPKENDYNGAREYVQERMQNDRIFKDFWNKTQWKGRADYLSDIFGWEVNEHHLNVNWNRNNK